MDASHAIQTLLAPVAARAAALLDGVHPGWVIAAVIVALVLHGAWNADPGIPHGTLAPRRSGGSGGGRKGLGARLRRQPRRGR